MDKRDKPTDLEARLAISLGLVLTTCGAWTLEESEAAKLALPTLRALPDALALGLADSLERGLTCYQERNRPELLKMRQASLAAARGGAA